MKTNLERAGELLMEAHKLLDGYHGLQAAIQLVFNCIDAEIDYQDERAAQEAE